MDNPFSYRENSSSTWSKMHGTYRAYSVPSKEYWTKVGKKTLGRRDYSGKQSLFHIFLDCLLYFWWIVGTRHTSATGAVHPRPWHHLPATSLSHPTPSLPHKGAEMCPTREQRSLRVPTAVGVEAVERRGTQLATSPPQVHTIGGAVCEKHISFIISH